MKLFIILALLLLPSGSWAKKVKYRGPDKVNVQDSISLRDLKQTTLKVPEKFLFDINWGWVNGGQATLELLPHKKNLWKIRSRAWCNDFFQSVYPVQDTIFSIIDSLGIYPIQFEKNLHEGTYEAHIKSWFDQEINKAWLQDTIVSIEPFTHDILSAFYFIRTQTLEVGKTFKIAAVSGKKKYQLKVICHRRETITVQAGSFKTIVVEPIVVGVGLFKAKGKLTIWLTDDDLHMPVKMKSKIAVGSITGELIHYQIGNQPGQPRILPQK